MLPLQKDDILTEEQPLVIKTFSNNLTLKLHILRADMELNSNSHEMDSETLKDINFRYSKSEGISFYKSVTHYIAKNNIDMLSLIVHNKTFIQRLFTESPTLELSRIAKVPLLIFHTKPNH